MESLKEKGEGEVGTGEGERTKEERIEEEKEELENQNNSGLESAEAGTTAEDAAEDNDGDAGVDAAAEPKEKLNSGDCEPNTASSPTTPRESKDIKGNILSMKFWFLDTHEAGKKEDANENGDAKDEDGVPKIEIIGTNSIANANLDEKPSKSATFTKSFTNCFEEKARNSRRAKQIVSGVFLGVLALVACCLGVLYVSENSKNAQEPGGDAGAGAGSPGGGTARSGGVGIRPYQCQIEGQCAETGKCVDIVRGVDANSSVGNATESSANLSYDHFCICDFGFRGKRCDQDFCSLDPCLKGETCVVTPGGIPDCHRRDVCSAMDSNEEEEDREEAEREDDEEGRKLDKEEEEEEEEDRKEAEKEDQWSELDEEEEEEEEETETSSGGGCLNDAVCIPTPIEFEEKRSEFACICKKFFYGIRCEEKLSLADSSADAVPQPLPCDGAKCENGGNCVNLNMRERKCVCPEEFTGERCEKKLSPCEVKICKNGGNCEEENGKAKCNCPPQYHGDFCGYPNGCHNHPCYHKSHCTPFGNGSFACNCSIKYMGKLCKEENLCWSNPCKHNGTCVLMEKFGERTYRCNCDKQNYVGETCDIESPCKSRPCLNGGTCEPETRIQNGKKIRSFKCDCDSEKWTGKTCEKPSACATTPCLNGANCTVTNDGKNRKCHCATGFGGDSCGTRLGQG